MPETALTQDLTAEQEVAALAIANGQTQREAAKTAGVCERTVRNWLHDIPAFGKQVDSYRDENVSRVKRYFAGKAYRVANIILQMAEGELEPSSTRLEACKTALSHAIGKPGQQGVAVEAVQRDGEQGIRVVVGNP